MTDQQSESQNDGLDDLGSEICAMSPVIQPGDDQRAALRELDDMGLDDLELGDGPIDPGPNMSAEELAKMTELENRQEAEAELAPVIDDLIAQSVAEHAEAKTETRDQALLRLAGGYVEKLRQPKPKSARKSKLSPRQAEIIEYRKSPEGKPAWNEYQLAKRWAKAEADGRTIIPRQSRKHMSPEEKAALEREQAAERQRKRRAAQKATT